MITHKNGFGNDKFCTFLSHGNETVITPIPPPKPYFWDVSRGSSSPHQCTLTGVTQSSTGGVFNNSPCWNATSFGGGFRVLSCDTNTSDWNFGTNNFCIDFWIKVTGGGPISAVGQNFGSNGCVFNSNNFYGFFIDGGISPLLTHSTGLTFGVKNAGSWDFFLTMSGITSIWPDAVNWYHVAVSRYFDTIRLFFNGKIVATKKITPTYSMPLLNFPYLIGGISSVISSLSAYYCEFRITNGHYRWKRDFIPPNRMY
jgi:hypothetical protein